MSYSFEYIDIILLAMIAGFIFLRLRGILGKKTGFEGKIPRQIEKEFNKINLNLNLDPKLTNENFDEEAQKDFLNGAKIAYETIITDFSDSDNKLVASKPLLGKKTHDQFKEALLDRKNKGYFAEITFIGINSAVVKNHKKIENNLEVTVDFVSEIITCIKDKDKKIVSGDSEKIKTVYDTWVFSKDIKSSNPNWLLIDTIT
jgi:predicted lipid-binding transport protein (Tim44 family)